MTRRTSNLTAHPFSQLATRRMGQPHRLALAFVILAGLTPGISAQGAERSRAELDAQIAKAQGVVHACAAAASACDAAAVPDEEAIAAQGAQPKFTMHWGWLRDALDEARNAKPQDAPAAKARQDAMQASAARLEELGRQVAPETGSAAGKEAQADFVKARRATDDVLAGVAFDKVAPPSWWDRLLAKFWAMFGRLFDGFGRLGKRAPWLGKALEWLLFMGAAVGLLFFVRRNFQRQRLAASLRGETATLSAWDREATDWATMAEHAAQAGEWREAVHCLYWASIVRLESRRAWRHNPARTPREYVRLLKPGSVQRESLGGLTGLLERVWYGLRPAGAEEYRRARLWFERLSESGAGAPLTASGDRA